MQKLAVVYEDNHVLVVRKPANVLSQGDETGDPSMVDIAKHYLKSKYQKAGNVYLGLVHRLDRPVSGLLLLAKTSKAAERLSLALSKKEIQRNYLAIAEGAVPTQTMEHHLLQDKQGFVRAVKNTEKNAQRALLHTECLAQKENTSLCYVRLETGRKHQIRVQFQSIGHPLLYDMRYGQGQVGKQIALYGATLSFTHPTTKEKLFFCSHPIDDGEIHSFQAYKDEITSFLHHLGEEHERNTSTAHL